MSDGYFGVLLKCALVSAALLVGATFMAAPPLLAMLLAGAPLGYYHLSYLRPRAEKGLSQAAIDSVYYFGFLITVAALATSAIAIAKSGAETNVNTVLMQFGIGLFATGYAVLARMHLSSISRLVDQTSPEAVMDRYVKRSLELVDNVELAAVRTAELSSSIMLKTAEVSEAARAATEKSLLDVARMFENEMKATLSLARDGLTEIRGLVADTTFVSEREELTRSIRATVEISTRLNSALEELTKRASEGVRASEQSIQANSNLAKSLDILQTNISGLAAHDGPLVQSADSIRLAGVAIGTEVSSIGEVVGSLKEIASDVKDTGPTFRNFRTMGKRTSDQLEMLSKVTQRLDTVLSSVSGRSESVVVLVSEIDKAAKALPQLTVMSERLTAGLGQTVNASSQLQERLDQMPKQAEAVSALTNDVNAGLKRIVESIERAAADSQRLQTSNAEALKLVEGAKELLVGAGSLQSTVASLQDVIGAFSSSVTIAQNNVVKSSDALKASIATSASKLEADVTRSAQATTLLTDRLIQVAQNIIDRTRAQQGSAV